jgi:two-component sensor histidine kinase
LITITDHPIVLDHLQPERRCQVRTWRNSLTAYILAGAAIIIGLGLLGLMAAQAIRREDEYAAALERRVEERTTDLQSVVAEKELLLQEMGHRVMNAFATVQAVHRHTRRRADDLETYSKSFEARLASLANAHALVADANGRDEVELRELLRVELAPYAAPGRLICEGPEVWLERKSALTLGLVVHELTTNASKYGCLPNEDGRLAVMWEVGASGTERSLLIRWTESGGPPVQPPLRRGFGTELIERSLRPPNSVTIHHGTEGVRAEISMRLAPHQQEGVASGSSDAA